jgi:hypothetical protein
VFSEAKFVHFHPFSSTVTMPAASSEKKACQRVNKLLQMEAEANAPSSTLLTSKTAEIAPECLTTASSPSFTISYTPLLHPEPAATCSGTNAIQVTQFELSKILCQAFQQGLEQGYKSDLADAIEKFNVQYEDHLAEALNDFVDFTQEYNDNAFEEGFSAGI